MAVVEGVRARVVWMMALVEALLVGVMGVMVVVEALMVGVVMAKAQELVIAKAQAVVGMVTVQVLLAQPLREKATEMGIDAMGVAIEVAVRWATKAALVAM